MMAPRFDVVAFASRVNELAPLPALAFKVLQLAEDQRSSAGDLASIIATDPALTAKILRLSNSVYYSPGRKIATVRDAVVLLGIGEIRRLVLTTSLMDRFARDGDCALNIPAFWGHSIAVGMVAEVMARQTGLAAPEEAFTAGILHDIGKLVMSQYEPADYTATARLAFQAPMSLEEAELEVFGFSHAELGAHLAELWRLPEAMADAIGAHHQAPDQSAGLGFVMATANSLCRDHGLWCGFEDVEPGATAPAASDTAEDPVRAAALAKLGGIERIRGRIDGLLQALPRAAASSTGRAGAPPEPAPSFSTHPAIQPLRRAPWVSPDRWPGRADRLRERTAGW
jgi:putative nucleotidyltransferase with HDIG domain